ncbi:MAG TPA: three-Cys-motif partner protein TcmP [Anaerohalosphaeraceae bacterium]|nr:three-Cys-motif partner protein TcmP [Anaerohalosphaeraceae bacterium]
MATDESLEFDEIGCWSEIKLEILRKYAPAYTTILSRQSSIKGYHYIDGFAGYGIHKSKTRDELIKGSPLIALQVKPKFTAYHFVDLDNKKVDFLRQLSFGYSNARVYEGDCNKILLERVFPLVRHERYQRALCLLDPYGLHLRWEVILAAGRSRSIEIFLNFPVMDMNRNVLWKNSEKVSPKEAERLTAFWGDESWKNAAYQKQEGLFGTIEEKTHIEKVALAFQKRLKEVAGFVYVSDPLPMKNTHGALLYYLFFATPNKTADKIVKDIMNKYRS